jgi:hypothetical protein
MSLHFFSNVVNNPTINSMPPKLYEDLQQQFINLEWDNTAVIENVQEQKSIGSDEYNEIEVWVDATIADTTTGLKDTYDFLKFIFKDINHSVKRGLMYKFNDNYWIVHSYTPYDGLAQSCGVRRCNNFLRIIDPLNGALVKIPCIIDYDMSSPSAQTSRYIITPNNHAVVMVQGNNLSHRLLRTNTRFILGGRPFKLLAYQNAIEDDAISPENTLMYLDLYLDEIHNKDDIINGIADNGDYNYQIFISSQNMTINNGYTGYLNAVVQLNGIEVERNIVWSSSNKDIIEIEQDGSFVADNTNQGSAVIKATLEGNNEIFSEILITVTDEVSFSPYLFINPLFKTIRQYDTVNFSIGLVYGNETYYEFDEIDCTLSDNSNQYATLTKNNDGTYSLKGEEISPSVLNFNVSIIKNDLNISVTQIFSFSVVSMLG